MRRAISTLIVAAAAAAFVPQPASAGTGTTRSTLRPVGSPVMSDAEAARMVKRSSEIRPTNTVENQTVPSASALAEFHSYTGQWGKCDNLRQKVTGNFKGTTDEIIQWTAWKWGLPEQVARAAAVNESWWKMSTVGDAGQSFGLYQIRNVAKWHGGTYPLSKNSTAFNADYWGGMVRHYYEGCATWLKDYSYNGSTYAAGDLWGAIGAWYAGNWHSDGANRYIGDVRRHKKAKTWTTSGF